MSNESIYQRITAAIIAGDKDKLLIAVEEALRGGMTPSDIICTIADKLLIYRQVVFNV